MTAAADQQVKERLIAIQQAILDVQGQLADAQTERLGLLDQLARAQAELRDLQGERARLSGYELHEVAPGMRLYKSKADNQGDKAHYACPKCYSGAVVGLMQQTRWDGDRTRFICAVCNYTIITGDAPPRERRISYPRGFGPP